MENLRTWAEIDLDALAQNFREVRRATDPKALVCSVVKADAYGHGAVRVARELEALGTDYFAVSNPEEALELRLGGIKRPILILGYTPAGEVRRMAENDISLCVYSLKCAEDISQAAVNAGVTVKAHLKIDTGMSRLGFYFQDLMRDIGTIDEIEKAYSLPGLRIEGIFTHFAVSDDGEAGDIFTMRQFGCFKELDETLRRDGIRIKLRHCANSAAVFDYPLSHLDMVRAGVVLYGIPPSEKLRAKPVLRPVLSLRSVISHIKRIEPGSTVSYGRIFEAERPMTIATVPIGYADGYSRSLSSSGEILIRGRRCKILGRICMDQLMADVTEVPGASLADTVTLIGRDGEEEITAGELAKKEGSIPYEVICGISKRVTRVYLKDGKTDSIYDQIVKN